MFCRINFISGKKAGKIQSNPRPWIFSVYCWISQLGQGSRYGFARKGVSAVEYDTHLPKVKAKSGRESNATHLP